MKNELGHFRLLMFTTCRYDTNFSINLYTFGKHIHVYCKQFIINKTNKTTKMFCKQKLHAKLAKLRSWNIKRERKWLMNIWSERPKGGNLIIACTSLVFPVSRNFSTRLTWSQSLEIDSTWVIFWLGIYLVFDLTIF